MPDNNLALLKNITVLYAEDEEILRDVTLNVLKSFTKKQYVAEDGVQGLELFKKYHNKIDLIITDVNMPNMNGLEMAKAIKAINPNIPIIVATAFSNTEYLLEAINLGIDKYVLKPLDIKKLLDIMSQSLLYHELKDLYTDHLTGLPNRNKLRKDLKETPEDLMALINIDKFSTINDLYGEANGDRVLSQFANRIKETFTDDRYTVYRVGSDKFAVVAKDINTDTTLFVALCHDFATNIEANSIIIDGNEIDINVTIGIAKSKGEDAYTHTQRVIGYARRKFVPIMFYDESLNIKESFEENIKWVKKIKQGIQQDLFKAYFQPIVNTKTKEIYKYEALIRYIDTDGKAVAPFFFLDIAKRAKLYHHFIKIMLKETLNFIKQTNKKVALNISFDDIADENSVNHILAVLKNNIDLTSNLEFEILESEKITDFDTVSNFIQSIKKLGCKIGIDDFGEGYSNFNILVKLNVDYVKIDGSLIKEIHTDANTATIVDTIVTFSKKIGFMTIAEFVSNENIYNKVNSLNIDYCQGYYFDYPKSLEEILGSYTK